MLLEGTATAEGITNITIPKMRGIIRNRLDIQTIRIPARTKVWPGALLVAYWVMNWARAIPSPPDWVLPPALMSAMESLEDANSI